MKLDEIIDLPWALPKPDEAWAPLYYTKPLTPFSRGDYVAEFANTFMKNPALDREAPLELMAWQKWLLNAIMEENVDGSLRYKTILVGIPRKNGKSLLSSTLALYCLVFAKSDAQIYSAAKNREQAGIIFREAAKQVELSPYLSRYLNVTKTYIENRSNGARYKTLPFSSKAAQGLGGSLVLLDELHVWSAEGRSTEAKDFYDALTTGSSNRKESLVVAITTAGGDKNTLCGEMYENGVKLANGEIEDPYTGFFWWGAEETDDPTDPVTWYKANPNLSCGLLYEENFEAAIKRANVTDFTSFLRLNLNMWIRLKGQGFITEFHWEKASKPELKIPLGAEVVIGFDGSDSDDSTGFLLMDVHTGQMELAYYWQRETEDDNWIVPRNEVNQAVENLFRDYNVKMLYADRAYYGSELLTWSQKWPDQILSFVASTIRMKPMTRDFLQDIYAGEISHNGDPILTQHAMNAVMKENGTPTKDKPNSPRKIDFLYCAILANGARKHVLNTYEPTLAPL